MSREQRHPRVRMPGEHAAPPASSESSALVGWEIGSMLLPFEELVDGVAVLDSQGRIMSVNGALLHLLGYEREELVGQDVSKLVPESWNVDHAAAIGRYLATGVSQVVGRKHEVEMLARNGERIPVELSVSTCRNQSGVFFVGIARDIRRRRRAEMLLEQSAGRWQALLGALPICVLVLDGEGRASFGNNAWLELTGNPPDDESWIQSVVPEHREQLLRQIALACETGRVVRGRFDLRSAASGVRHMRLLLKPLAGSSASRGEAIAIAEDVTEYLSAQEELERSEHLHRWIVERALEAIVTTDRQGRILSWNPKAEEIFGWTFQDVALRPFLETVFGGGAPKELSDVVLGRSKDDLAEFTCWARRRDGREFPAVVAAARDETPSGPVCMLFLKDGTDHWIAEESVRQTHRQLSELLCAIPAALIVFDLDGITYHWNELAESLFQGWAPDDREFTIWDLPVGWDAEEIRRRLGRLNEGEMIRLASIPVGGGVSRRFCDVTLTRIEGAAEERRFLWSAADVTEQRELESQLVQAQKLESIGQLAAGIAHEINTPTQYVSDNVRFLQDAFQDLLNAWQTLQRRAPEVAGGSELVRLLDEVASRADLEYLLEQVPAAIAQSLDGLQRVATIVRAMKEFSHPNATERTAVDLNRALESTVNISRNEWKYVADVKTRFDPNLPVVHCFAGELNQVFLNLIVNAAHAIAEKVGQSGEKGGIEVGTKALDDGWVEIWVSDTGCGIPEAIRERVFDPFFTTKPVGKGTGQGLSIAYNVVSKHGGRIWFDSVPGEGTTFRVRIPTAYDSDSSCGEVAAA